MGQWPIFSGALLLLPRLALLPFLRISPSLSRSLSLWAFELISAGSTRCLIGHEAVCKEKGPSLLLSLSLSRLCHLTSSHPSISLLIP